MGENNIEVLCQARAMDKDGKITALQYCRCADDENNVEYGYRFVCCDPGGDVIGETERFVLPSLSTALKLINEATKSGWSLNNIENDDMKIIDDN